MVVQVGRALAAAPPPPMSKLTASFRLTVGAGKASPQPPVGSALGQRGLNLMNFCKAFNDQTAQYIVGTPMQVRLAASCQLAKRSLAWPRWHISAGRACLRQFEAQLNFFRPLQVQVRAFADRTFEFDVKTPRTSYFLKKAAGLEKGATTPGTQIAGRLSLKDIYEIAKVLSLIHI